MNPRSYATTGVPHWRSSGSYQLALEPDALAPRRMPSLLAVLLGLYMFAVPIMSFSERLQANVIPQAIGAVLGFVWLVIGLPSQGWRPSWPRPVVLYMLWVIWALSGLPITLNASIFLEHWLTVLKVAAVAWLASQVVRTRADLLAVWCFISLASVVIFVVDHGAIVSATTRSTQIATRRATETLVENANSLAYFGLLSLLGALSLFFAVKSVFLKLMTVAAVPIFAVIVAASGSRKGLICFALIGVGVYFFHWRRLAKIHGTAYRIMALLAGFAVGTAAIYYISTTPFFSRIKESMTTARDLQHEARYKYFLNALEATAQHPVFGLGLQGFTMSGLSGAKGHYSHSTVAESLSCTGVPGFILIYWSLFSFLNLVRKTRKLPLHKPDLALVNMGYLFSLLFILFGFAAVTLNDRTAWPLMGALCGYLRNLRTQASLASEAPAYYTPGQ